MNPIEVQNISGCFTSYSRGPRTSIQFAINMYRDGKFTAQNNTVVALLLAGF